MNHQDILRAAASTLNERGKSYGDAEFVFDTIAQLATLITGRVITPYEVSVIHECTKLARRRVDPLNADHYIDQINYTAFSGQMARIKTVPNAAHEPVSVSEAVMEKMEADIIKMAKKLAPVQTEQAPAQIVEAAAK